MVLRVPQAHIYLHIIERKGWNNFKLQIFGEITNLQDETY